MDRGRPLLALVFAGLLAIGGIVIGLLATGTLSLSNDEGTETEIVAAATESSTEAPPADAAPSEPTEAPEPTVEPTPAPSPGPTVSTRRGAASSPVTSRVINGGDADSDDGVEGEIDAADPSAPGRQPDPTVPAESAPEPEPTGGPVGASVSVTCNDSLSEGTTRLATISWTATNGAGGSVPAVLTLGGAEIASEILAPGVTISRSYELPDSSSVAMVAAVAVNGTTRGSATVPWCS